MNSATGTLHWSHKIADYNGLSGSVSRTSPAISGNTIIIGDHTQKVGMHAGANVIAINRSTGALLWKTLVETHPAAIITGSPVVASGVVYVGVSSYEESLAKQSGYACCTFRGSVVALNVNTGKKLWQTYVVPNNFGNTGGYSGGAIWQPAAIDLTRKLLYIGTGNNYSVPASVEVCEQSGIKAGKIPNCTAANDHFDSALALNLADGSIKWAVKTSRWDATNEACESTSPGPDCPTPAGADIDVGGDGPNLVGNLVVFGQKNGYLRAYNADTGQQVWATGVGRPAISEVSCGERRATESAFMFLSATRSTTLTNSPRPVSQSPGALGALSMRKPEKSCGKGLIPLQALWTSHR